MLYGRTRKLVCFGALSLSLSSPALAMTGIQARLSLGGEDRRFKTVQAGETAPGRACVLELKRPRPSTEAGWDTLVDELRWVLVNQMARPGRSQVVSPPSAPASIRLNQVPDSFLFLGGLICSDPALRRAPHATDLDWQRTLLAFSTRILWTAPAAVPAESNAVAAVTHFRSSGTSAVASTGPGPMTTTPVSAQEDRTTLSIAFENLERTEWIGQWANWWENGQFKPGSPTLQFIVNALYRSDAINDFDPERFPEFRAWAQGRLLENGLPSEFDNLALVESGFNVNAGSPVGAVGVWQFMPATATRYGLRVDLQNSQYDERRDPYRATDAACEYLKTLLTREFSSLARRGVTWEETIMLMLAAYNAGEGKVWKAIRSSPSQSLSVPQLCEEGLLVQETCQHVPKILGASRVRRAKGWR